MHIELSCPSRAFGRVGPVLVQVFRDEPSVAEEDANFAAFEGMKAVGYEPTAVLAVVERGVPWPDRWRRQELSRLQAMLPELRSLAVVAEGLTGSLLGRARGVVTGLQVFARLRVQTTFHPDATAAASWLQERVPGASADELADAMRRLRMRPVRLPSQGPDLVGRAAV